MVMPQCIPEMNEGINKWMSDGDESYGDKTRNMHAHTHIHVSN